MGIIIDQELANELYFSDLMNDNEYFLFDHTYVHNTLCF